MIPAVCKGVEPTFLAFRRDHKLQVFEKQNAQEVFGRKEAKVREQFTLGENLRHNNTEYSHIVISILAAVST
jgi:hypothetical protein